MDGTVQAQSHAARLQRCVDDVREALQDIAQGRLPDPLDEDGCHGDVVGLIRAVNRLIVHAREIAAIVEPLSHGHFEGPAPSPDNIMAAPFVQMRERFAGLTEKAGLVARGDYDERLASGDDFSAAFDAMTRRLAEREETLRSEIARRQEAERRLQRERDLLVAGPLVTFRWDADDEGMVRYVSPNISAFGYEAEEFTGGRRRYGEVIHPDDRLWLMEDSRAKAQAGLDGWTHDYRIFDAGGKTRWVRDYTHAVRGDDGTATCYEGYIIDVTAQKQAEVELRRREEQLRVLSLADDVTGLYNRRGLLALGEHLLRTARRHRTGVSILYVDVDELRRLNDRYGHARGDQALREVAAALRAAVHEADVLGRAGGDEFVALVESAGDVTDELSRRLRRRLSSSGRQRRGPRVTVSIGRLHWDGDGDACLQELIDGAAADLQAQHLLG